MNVVGKTNLITSDDSSNNVNLIAINLIGQINCRGANLISIKLINVKYDEVQVMEQNISFKDVYSIVHCNTSESIEKIIKITPELNLKAYSEFYFRLPNKSSKTVNFSKEGGNIYNNLSIDISSDYKLIKATLIPCINKYKIEIV